MESNAKQTLGINKDLRAFRKKLRKGRKMGKRVNTAEGKDGELRDGTKGAERRERAINWQTIEAL